MNRPPAPATDLHATSHSRTIPGHTAANGGDDRRAGSERQRGSTLNPLTCLRLIQRLGTDYLLILSSIVLLGIAGTAIVSASGGALPPIVRIVLLMYGWLAIFAASTRMIPDEPPPTR